MIWKNQQEDGGFDPSKPSWEALGVDPGIGLALMSTIASQSR